MSHVFQNVNGFLVLGADVQEALMFLPPYAGLALKLVWQHPFSKGDKAKPTVLVSGAPAVGFWHEPANLWPHMPVFPIGLDIMMAVDIWLGTQICWLPRTKVVFAGDWATPTIFPGPLSLNLDCWAVGALPTGLVFNAGTVVTTPDVWDLLEGVVAAIKHALVDLVLGWAIGGVVKLAAPRLLKALEGDFVAKIFPVERFRQFAAKLPFGSNRLPANRLHLGGDPVSVSTGDVVARAQDLVLPGVIPIHWRRNYSSAAALERTALGRGGWSHTWDAWVLREEDVVTVRLVDGREAYFKAGPPGQPVFHRRERLELVAERDGGYRCYDPEARLTSVFAPPEGSGRAPLRAIVDPHGNEITLHYEGSRLARIVSPEGRELRVTTDARGRVTRVAAWAAGAEREEVSYRYHPTGELAAVTHAGGGEDRFSYDEEHRLAAATYADGQTFTYEYDEITGWCIRSAGEGDRHEVILAPDLAARVTRRLGSSARVYEWNEAGLVTRESTPDGEVLEEIHYDEDLFPVLIKSGERWRAMEYDERGHLTRVTGSGGEDIRYRYALDLLVETDAGSGQVSRYGHDERGSVTRASFPSGEVFEIGYDERGRMTHLDRGGQRLGSFRYDELGNRVEEVAATGAVTRYHHDPLGRVTAQVDPLDQAIHVRYTGNDVTAIETAAAPPLALLDASRAPVRVVDAIGRETVIGRRGGVIEQVRTPDGAIARYEYDGEERLRALVNPLGERHELQRDLAGRVERERTSDGRDLRYELDAMGQPTRLIEADGTQRAYRYDAGGRLVGVEMADLRLHYEYDERGLLRRAVAEHRGEAFVTDIERDALGRIVAEQQGGRAVTYEHAGFGRRAARRLPDGATSRYAYDALGRLAAVDHAGHRVEIERDALGREVVRRAGAVELWTGHDRVGQIAWQRVTARRGGGEQILVDRAFAWDPAGQLVGVREGGEAAARYAYDAAGRLIEAEDRGSVERFAYDPAGSLLGRTAAGTSRTFEIGPGNRLRSEGQVDYEHDRRGRRTRMRVRAGDQPGPDDAITEYTWDSADQLREVRLPSGARVRFTYDALGRRVRKEVHAPPADPCFPPGLDPGGAPPRVTEYLWDGDQLAAEIDEAGLRAYVFVPGTFLPLLEVVGGRALVHVVNQVGAPTELLDPAGEIAWAAQRSAWGRVTAAPGDPRAGTLLRQLGHLEDPETGLFHTRCRYFDPDTARWISPDPIGIEGGPNLYAFQGAPTITVDPFGLGPGWPQGRKFTDPIKEGWEIVRRLGNQLDGYYPVIAHGNGRLLAEMGPDGKVVEFTLFELAERIRRDPNWGGRPILLLVCHGADQVDKGVSMSTVLSRVMGKDVIGGTAKIHPELDRLGFSAMAWDRVSPDGTINPLSLIDNPWALTHGMFGLPKEVAANAADAAVARADTLAARAAQYSQAAAESAEAARRAAAAGDTDLARQLYAQARDQATQAADVAKQIDAQTSALEYWSGHADMPPAPDTSQAARAAQAAADEAIPAAKEAWRYLQSR